MRKVVERNINLTGVYQEIEIVRKDDNKLDFPAAIE